MSFDFQFSNKAIELSLRKISHELHEWTRIIFKFIRVYSCDSWLKIPGAENKHLPFRRVVIK